MSVGDIVFDRWWWWRLGVVVKRTKTRLRVMWSDGEVWNYDRPHQRFLKRLSPRMVAGW